jgi:hypothetical protein
MEKAVISREHYQFKDIHEYLLTKKYPAYVKLKGDKANFRRATRSFALVEQELFYCRRRKDGTVKQVGKLTVIKKYTQLCIDVILGN